MMKKTSALIVLFCMLFSMTIIPISATTETEMDDTNFKYFSQATKLSEVGVFVGTGDGFELYRAPNRLEALVVLVRLLGAEDEAKQMASNPCPFNDVPEWGSGYVNYAFSKGLTLGMGNGIFGATELISSNAYTTFMLRALGYNDSLGDFNWEQSNQFALDNRIVQSDLYNELNTESFIRNHMASISYSTLTATMKSPKITLNEFLVNIGKMDANVDVFKLNTSGSVVVEIPKDTTIPEVTQPEITNQLPLLGSAPITQDTLKVWARSKGMSEEGIQLVDIYYELCGPKGLNPVIQYVQMCYETGWLYKTASGAGLDSSFHNPCGLKTTEGGGDYDANAHKRFETWRDGIDAHTDHSALYAGAPGYPRVGTLDPRHFNWIRGRATTVEQLSGTWAPSLTYHVTILRLYNEAINFK